MNRLRDDVGEDPIAERGIEMLRGIAATPSMPELKRKVWGAIQQQRLRAAAPRPMRRLRMAAAFAVVLCLAGTAGAVLTQRWIIPGRARLAEPAPVASRATSNVRGRARPSTSPAAMMEVAAPVAAPAPAVAVQAPREFARTRSVVRASSARRPTLIAPASELSAASARERTEVLDAMVALRRDHDADRAGRLLEGYLSAHPRGVLREEAMVLAIEAADARNDGSSARQLARMYQATYPGGRFSVFAREHATADRP